jgi:hypothetical protein
MPTEHYGDALDFDPERIHDMLEDGRATRLERVGDDPEALWR